MTEKHPGHGSHWEPFFDVATRSEEVTLRDIEKSRLFGSWPCMDVINGSDEAEQVLVVRNGDDRVTRQYLLVTDSRAGEKVVFTGYPVLLDGIEHAARIENVRAWTYGIEGWIECLLDASDISVSFFDPTFFAGSSSLAKGERVEVSFAALACRLGPLERPKFSIDRGPLWEMKRERRLAEGVSDPEASQPMQFDLSAAAIYLPRPDWAPDEAEFQGVVELIERLEHDGIGIYRIELVIKRVDEEAWRIPVFATDRVLGKYVPSVGEAVQGTLWLQGRVTRGFDDKTSP